MKQTISLMSFVLLAMFGLSACGSDGGGGGSGVSAPAAPTGLTADAGGAEVNLDWDNTTGATSYVIYYSTSAGVTKLNGTQVTTTVSSHVLSGLTNGSSYYFRVAARNSGGESALSTEVSATPQVDAPSAPTNIMVTEADSQLSISWDASTGATGYDLYYSTSTGVTTGDTQVANVTSPHILSSLTNSTQYFLVLTATNAGGTSAISAEVSGTPLAATAAPNAPTISALTGGYHEVIVSFSPVAGATSYNLYYDTMTGVSSGSGTAVMGISSPYTLDGLDHGTEVFVVITAENMIGESADSNELSATPSNPQLSALQTMAGNGGGFSDTAASASGYIWVMVYDDNSINGDPVEGVEVYLSSTTGATLEMETTDSDGTARLSVGTSTAGYITIWDDVVSYADTFYGSDQFPLRTHLVTSTPRGAYFDVSLSGLTNGNELSVWMNNGEVEDGSEGEPLYRTTVGGTTAQFNINRGIVAAGEPWMLMALEHDSNGDLVNAAVLYDLNGSEALGGSMQSVVDMDMSAGTTSVNGLEAMIAMPTMATTLSGNYSAPSGVTGVSIEDPEVQVSLSNSFGRFVIDAQFDANSDMWSLEFPDLSAVSQLELSAVAAFSTTVVARTSTNAVALAHRLPLSGVTGQNIDLSAMNDLDLGTLHVSFDAHVLSGANGTIAEIEADFVTGLGTDLAYLTQASATSTSMDIPTLIGTTVPTPVSHGFWINDFDGEDGDPMNPRNRAFIYGSDRAMAPPILEMGGMQPSTTGDTGSPSARIEVNARIAGAPQTLGMTSSSPTSSNFFDRDGDIFTWDGTGLTGRNGVIYVIEIEASAMIGNGRANWNLQVPGLAVSSAGGSSYSVRLPQISGIIGLGDSIDYSILALDATGDGLDVTQGIEGNDISVGVEYYFETSLAEFLTALKQSRIWAIALRSEEGLLAQ